ncbi:hypothetical protein QP892_03165 [Corynebacterium pseudodiphtheriticum]|uniref:hypothetical protein n=1 Tax=Corynebacterium pseudodiphtheriticum TaxID=37637 RepID=UPI00254F38FD|nr:hypothetical protein [Corynebacterium pseudodiphtheriticum]MDK8717517.1 hypothetical protein [Corynebacterium pseudodiphtheriticum]
MRTVSSQPIFRVFLFNQVPIPIVARAWPRRNAWAFIDNYARPWDESALFIGHAFEFLA